MYFDSSKVKQQALESGGDEFYGGLKKAWTTSRGSGSIKRARELVVYKQPNIRKLLLKWEYRSELHPLKSEPAMLMFSPSGFY